MSGVNLAERRIQYQKDLAEALSHIVEYLASIPDVEKVILFGSYGTKKSDLLTDLDLLVMRSDKDFIDRTAELYAEIRAGVDFDLLVYTPEEWQRQKQKSFIRQALKSGKVLYEKRRD